MSEPIYRGGMVADVRAAAVQQQQEAAESQLHPDTDVVSSVCETVNPHLTGETPTAAGNPVHAEVPNLVVQHVSTPSRAHTLPANVATDQSVFTAARPRAGR